MLFFFSLDPFQICRVEERGRRGGGGEEEEEEILLDLETREIAIVTNSLAQG